MLVSSIGYFKNNTYLNGVDNSKNHLVVNSGLQNPVLEQNITKTSALKAVFHDLKSAFTHDSKLPKSCLDMIA